MDEGGLLSASAASQGVGTREAGQLIECRREEAVTADERAHRGELLWAHLLHVGRPSQAQAALKDTPLARQLALIALAGLFADGDSAATLRAIRVLRSAVGTPLVGINFGAVFGRYAAGQYAIEHGDAELARRVVADLSSARMPRDSAWASGAPPVLALMLRAQLAAKAESGDAGDFSNSWTRRSAKARGAPSCQATSSPPGCTRPGERSPPRWPPSAGASSICAITNSTSRTPAKKAWLAALTGDREGAIKAYRRYLALRIDPEAALRPQVAQVRADLEALERESTDR